MGFKEKKAQAIKDYGIEVVNEVMLIVGLFDPDGAYTAFEDDGQEEHAECVRDLYFED